MSRETLVHALPVNGATWNADGTARVWDAQTGVEQARLEGDCSEVTSAQWNHDETRVMITTAGGHVYIYIIPRDELHDAACRRIPFNMTWGDWRQYFPDTPYRCTCSDLLAHPTVLEAVAAGRATIDPQTMCAAPGT